MGGALAEGMREEEQLYRIRVGLLLDILRLASPIVNFGVCHGETG